TSAIDGELTRIAAATARTAGVGQGLAVLLCGLAMWGALLFGVAAVHAGVLDGVLLAVVVLVPLAAFEIVSDLPLAAQTLHRARRAVARTLEVLDAPTPVVDPTNPLPVPRRPCGLEVRGLRARHRPDGPWVIDGLDLDLGPGRTVALVGRSGAGKSTLAEVLLRFLPYEQGSVRLGGVEIRDLCADEYRREVGLLTQDAHIFDATLEENLRLARRSATGSELRDALGRARLLDWIDTLPAGLATPAGPRGLQLSGGQRQRLAIARALLAGFPLLVVDEPGEHLDTATADALVADLLATTPEKAVLLITHRLAGLDAVDEVVVLEHGGVVQRGAHAELLRTAGPYARMWARETEGL
ncbi:MAG: amino acid ABC transporter ATP-binding/permease protein, partial [Solirubrobacteraceae bacterium]